MTGTEDDDLPPLDVRDAIVTAHRAYQPRVAELIQALADENARLRAATPPNRSPAGLVWMDLCRKFSEALRCGDETRWKALDATMKALEEEYPEAVKAEKELWG